MTRSFMFLGAILCGLGVGLLLLVWLVPLGGSQSDPTATWYSSYLVPAGVITAGLALAAGLALVGIGYGRWKHPISTRRPSPHSPAER